MIVYSARQNSTGTIGVRYTYQFLNSISVSGSTWNMSPPGYPVITGLLYTDADSDNSMPSIVSDNRISGGGYRVVLLDETSISSGRMLYTETGFEAPFVWTTPEVVSAPGADPARQGASTGVSSGVAVGTGLFENHRFAFWPDYRSGTVADVYCAWAEGEAPPPTPTPTITPSPLPTNTPTSTPTATPTSTPTSVPTVVLTPVPTVTPAPIPATGPAGVGGLLLLIGLLMGLSGRIRH